MDDIWSFVEKKMNVEVPAYFKTVLNVCGYDNGISISAIEDSDLEYIQEEVRSGNAGEAFDGSKEDFLEGCNKSAEHFEFVRGHKKFLMAIVDFLKKHLAENGFGSFNLNEKPSRKNNRKKPVICKKIHEKGPELPSQKKVGKLDPRVMPLVEHAMATELEPQQRSSGVSREILAEHRKMLLIRTIGSMFRHTEKLMKEEIVTVKQKISEDFLVFELDDDCDDTVAIVKCVYCPKIFTVYLRPTETNPYSWKTPNFDRHLRSVHSPEDEPEEKSGKTGNDSKSNGNPVGSGGKLCDLGVEQGAEVVGQDEDRDIEDKGEQEDEQVKTSDSDEKKVLAITGERSQASSNLDILHNPKIAGQDEQKGTLRGEHLAEEQKLHSKKRQKTKAHSLVKHENEKSELHLKVVPGEFQILKNGYKTRHGDEFIVTSHTCAFDAVMHTFAYIYSENSSVRGQIDGSRSEISQLLASMFGRVDKATSQSSSSLGSDLYINRNTILKQLYEDWCKGVTSKVRDTTFIDCTTGIGGLFSRMCKSERNFASAICEKKCPKCEAIFHRVTPFLKTVAKINDLGRIPEHLDLNPQERTCVSCKAKCEVRICFNNVVLLETEPVTALRNRKVQLRNISPELGINSIQYMLLAVMHFEAKTNHFVAFIHDHQSNNWKCIDDLKKNVQKVDATTEVNPFILCYVSTVRQFDFEKLIEASRAITTLSQSSKKQAKASPQKKHEPHARPHEPGVAEPATSAVLPAAQNEERILSKKRKKRHSSKIKKKNRLE